MKESVRRGTWRSTHRSKSSSYRESRNSWKTSADRSAPQLEALETRSLLSTIILNGFPAAGFRAETLGDGPPWDVAVIVDDQPITARGFAESTERLADAPGLERSSTGPSWIAGIIGDTMLRGSNAATNDVDLYRIDLPAGDHYAVHLQVLSQRFGSALDPAVSLLDGNGDVIASNDDALHAGFLSDAELFAGVDGGTYFIAVSAGGNLPGEGGFDPLVPGSGDGSRGTIGQYLLQFRAVPDTTRPAVVDASIEPNATLHAVPTEISVRFSEPMDLHGLHGGATLANDRGEPTEVAAIHYDSVALEATFLLLDRLPPGDYEFTLHAAQLGDRAGNPLAGGEPNGDFKLEFYIDTPTVERVDTESNDSAEAAQPLGPLFIRELGRGVQISGSVSAAIPDGDHDFYRFQITTSGFFTFRLQPGQATTQTGLLRLHDAAGTQLAQSSRFPEFGSSIFRWLTPGEYLIEMDASGNVPSGDYQLSIRSIIRPPEILFVDNNPAPAIQVVLRSHEGEQPTKSEPANSTESNSAADTPTSYSVLALPAVASEPAGQPRRPAASPTELAWIDPSSGDQTLPPGFELHGPSPRAAARFSVAGVSGTFYDSLPDAAPHGTHALDPSTHLVTELAALFRGGFSNDAAGPGTANGLGLPADAGAKGLDSNPSEWVADAGDVAPSPSLALGMVASIGAASVMTVPNRRRESNWLQRLVEMLGLG